MLCNMGRLDISYFEINQDDFGFVHIRNRENNKQFGQRKILWNKSFEGKGEISDVVAEKKIIWKKSF